MPKTGHSEEQIPGALTSYREEGLIVRAQKRKIAAQARVPLATAVRPVVRSLRESVIGIGENPHPSCA